MSIGDTQRNGAGSQRGLRRANAKRLIDTLRKEGPSSQALLARRSGLSRATVNNIIHSLVDDGVVQITAGATGRESMVSLVAATGAVIAIEVGPQRIRGSIVSFDRETRQDKTVDLDLDNGTYGDIESITTLISDLLEYTEIPASEVSRICVGLHAPYSIEAGTIAPSSFLPVLDGVDVREVLEQKFELPVHVDNDANFAALAEWAWGSGHGTDHFYYIECSSSIGSGIVLHGRVYHGSSGTAGEIGHVVIDDRGALCTCGSRGCLAAVASGRAILLQLQEAGNPKPSLRAVIDSALAGDASCIRVLAEAGHYIGRALAHVVRLIAPRVIAVGGGLALAGPLVLDGIRSELSPANLGGGAPPVDVAVGLLRGDMCILGCVAHVLDQTGGGISEIPTWLLEPTALRSPKRVT